MASKVSETNMSPFTKQKRKLRKHIRLTFERTGEEPSTTTEFYRIGKILGKGAFGKVNLAMHRLTEKLVAIKSINKHFLSDESSKRKVMQETYILKKLKHNSVIRLFETFETKKHILFVIEMCSGGDLLNYVRKR
jgi:5'-AMP-activated protein kinase catalytic alpha subunit